MYVHSPVLERAFEMAGSGCFRTLGEARAALAAEGYSSAVIYRVEERRAWVRVRTVCGDARYGTQPLAMSG